MENKIDVLSILKEVGAFREGHFQFSSGMHSETYIQAALLLKEPPLAEKVCTALADLFRDEKPEVVVGPAMGAVTLAYEVARQLGVTGLFTEREDGKVKLRRMFSVEPGQRVLVVEDIITTGLSSQEVVEALQELGANVIGVGAIVDRSNGNHKITVPYKALITRQMNKYDPAECPLCKAGIELYKPGSRKQA